MRLLVLIAAVVLLVVTARAEAAEQWLPARVADPPVPSESITSDLETGFDTDGTLVTVASRYNSGQATDRVVAYVRPPGGEVTRTSMGSDATLFADLAIDPRGGVAIAWWPGNGSTQLKIRRRPPGGTFGPTETLDVGVVEPYPEWEIGPDGRELFALPQLYTNGMTADRRLVIRERSGPGQPLGAPLVVTPNDLNTEDGNFSDVDLAIGPNGATAVAAEFRPTGGSNALTVARRGPGAVAFDAPDEIAPAGHSVESPNVEVDAKGRATVAFSSVDAGRRARIANAPANTGDFGAVAALSEAPGNPNHNYVDLAMAPSGAAVVGFGGGGTADQWATARGASSPDPGFAPQPFSVPMRVDGGFPSAEPPRVAMAADGVAYAVVASGNPGDKDLDAWRTANPAQAFQRTRVVDDDAGGDAHEYEIASGRGAVVLYKGSSGIDNQRTLMMVPYDDEPPTVGLTGPGSLLTGAAGDFAASTFDYWGPVTTTITHSDGATGTPHAFAAPGTSTTTATATDLAGFEATASVDTAVTAPPPAPATGGGAFPALPPRAARRPTASQVIKLPSARRCVSRRRFRIRLRRPNGLRLRSATVHVNGKRVRVVRGRRLTSNVDLRGLPRGRFRVKITVVTSTGQKLTTTRRYRTCTPKRRARR